MQRTGPMISETWQNLLCIAYPITPRDRSGQPRQHQARRCQPCPAPPCRAARPGSFWQALTCIASTKEARCNPKLQPIRSRGTSLFDSPGECSSLLEDLIRRILEYFVDECSIVKVQ